MELDSIVKCNWISRVCVVNFYADTEFYRNRNIYYFSNRHTYSYSTFRLWLFILRSISGWPDSDKLFTSGHPWSSTVSSCGMTGTQHHGILRVAVPCRVGRVSRSHAKLIVVRKKLQSVRKRARTIITILVIVTI